MAGDGKPGGRLAPRFRIGRAGRTISKIFEDFRKKGYTTETIFSIGSVEKRMSDFARLKGTPLATDVLYMRPQELGHARRDSKIVKGIAAEEDEIIDFPVARRKMALYYDTDNKNFNYVGEKSKFIVSTSREIVVSRRKEKVTAFVTAQKLGEKEVFNPPRFEKV